MATAQRGQKYDRGSTVFSPDGELFQVQYAQEAVKKGLTALGIKSSSGVILAAEKRKRSELVEARSVEKVFQIDDLLGVATSGLIADARILTDEARRKAQINRLRYDEALMPQTLAEEIGAIKQTYTQHGGVRPFGIKFLIGGVGEREAQLYETDPSGTISSYKAQAIGDKAEEARNVLEDRYGTGMGIDEMIRLALITLDEVIEENINFERVEIGKIDSENKKFSKMSSSDISEAIDSLNLSD
ncbi:hypothetical protein AKJ56_01625 [candidate division MSBL1 archaeon SCGC-AAA382N08]|uniref:Proteasome alpha-type subunits domain-containing protein n=1 Tax=candidate division MSBL1 archaeon SCGC-AAA382N08 TaxID=1698285 RepID=A0A133VP62_9EURY|nr:hypothetical protein AKJ56_01625 [candidate division MSBL1 archaeon SCGC-AAA382N08]